MPVTSLQFTNVGPFEEVAFEFDEQVNVFTGPNNSGKSTVLWVLGEVLVYPFNLPSKILRSDECPWSISYLSASGVKTAQGKLPSDVELTRDIFKVIGPSFFAPAQRLSTNYRSPGPTAGRESQSRTDKFVNWVTRVPPSAWETFDGGEIRRRIHDISELLRRADLMLTGTSSVSDEEIIQKIVDLDYAGYRRQQPAMRTIVETIASLASRITEGFPITFLGVHEDEDGLFPKFGTPSGKLPLNVLSQGTQSIIHWLAHLLIGYAEYYNFPPDFEEKPGILIIDEIDAHLHPSWQRRIIPALTECFPKLQIFCSTHSPLMLAGLKAGQVQLLRRDLGTSKVTVSRNESDIGGWTADEILRNFLDVPSPTDLATAGNVSRLQELRRKEKLSAEESEELEQLRHTVSQDLLNNQVTAEIERFAEILSKSRSESGTASESSHSPT